MKRQISGWLWLNEQDPYEPTGIVIIDKNGKETCLNKFIEEEFDIIPDSEPHITKYLTITIET